MKYPQSTMEFIRQNLGLEPADTSEDTRIESMSSREALDRVLTWHGIINYTGFIIGWVSAIYGVELKEE